MSPPTEPSETVIEPLNFAWPNRYVRIVGDLAAGAVAVIESDGRLLMPSAEAGMFAESYDWARFGRIAYQAITGREPPR